VSTPATCTRQPASSTVADESASSVAHGSILQLDRLRERVAAEGVVVVAEHDEGPVEPAP
jgi:hypothetical protein